MESPKILNDDDWTLMIFDATQDQSDDLLETNGKEFQGSFRQCATRALDFVMDNTDLQMRVVIERIM